MSCVRANWKKKKQNNNNNNKTEREKEREFWTNIFDSLHWPGIEPVPSVLTKKIA